MFSKILFVTILATFAYAFPTEDSVKHYDGYRVVRAIPESEADFEAVLKLAEKDYDFWQDPRPGGVADILTSPSQFEEVVGFLVANNVKYTVMIDDLEKLLFEERHVMNSRQSKKMDWENYHTWNEINEWLSGLVTNNSIITSEKYGSSFEGRDLFVYKVSTGGTNKPAFWIDSTIHAREHISTAVNTYAINQLVTNSSSYNDILSKVDFYFAPFINPDGYVYSQTVDRMWRRTRSNWTSSSSSCFGVDANRNFGFQFGGAGSSGTPCTETYRGPSAYSEPETNAVKNYINSKTNVNWQAFITLHSYSQLWMTPYGYRTQPPTDYADLKLLGDQAAAALKSHFNTAYEVGNAGSILYLSSGSSRDWAKGEGGFKWVYTIELRDTGRYGFLLPADQIMDTAVETWSGIQVVARKLAE